MEGGALRTHVSNACTNCKNAHVACDNGRPCRRCIRKSQSDSCESASQQKRGWRKGRPRRIGNESGSNKDMKSLLPATIHEPTPTLTLAYSESSGLVPGSEHLPPPTSKIKLEHLLNSATSQQVPKQEIENISWQPEQSDIKPSTSTPLDSMVWTMTDDGTIVGFSDPQCIWGYSRGELFGKSIFALLERTDSPILRRMLDISRESLIEFMALFRVYNPVQKEFIWIEAKASYQSNGNHPLVLRFDGHVFQLDTQNTNSDQKINAVDQPIDETLTRRRSSDTSAVENTSFNQRLNLSNEIQPYRLCFSAKHSPVDGSCVEITDEVEKILGYPKQMWSGRFFFEIIHPNDLPVISAALGSLCMQRHYECTVRMRIRHALGYYAWFESHANTVYDPESKKIQWIMCAMSPIQPSEGEVARADCDKPTNNFSQKLPTVPSKEVSSHYDWLRDRFVAMGRQPSEVVAYDNGDAMLLSDLSLPEFHQHIGIQSFIY